ncbi:MAG: hypothetical protein QF440_02470 [Candidatus Thalassarchaeaceae archaeon]|jgi:hypothetical protein|nr:hypothetical protein [Candidatus Thalassarchaeaceae archaeon]
MALRNELLAAISALVAIFCLFYIAYCVSQGGTHLRGKGWVTKEEHPKSYYFTLFWYFVLIIAGSIQALRMFYA